MSTSNYMQTECGENKKRKVKRVFIEANMGEPKPPPTPLYRINQSNKSSIQRKTILLFIYLHEFPQRTSLLFSAGIWAPAD